jgi:iron complex outermembrane recepter protein
MKVLMSSHLTSFLSIVLLLLPAPLLAQTAQTAPQGAEGDEEIIVTGTRLRGSAIGDIKPEVQIGGAEIRSLAVSSVAELLTSLSPQISSGQGRGGEAPVILLNGRRISSFAEVRDLPPEAIARIDILPEEVALKYGYAATRKVVNLVLRQRFRALTTELADAIATRGGRNTVTGSADILRISRGKRINLDAKYSGSSLLDESERDIIGGAGAFRSLLPRSASYTFNSVFEQPLAPSLGLTLNGRAEVSDRTSLLGLGNGNSSLRRNSQTLAGHVGATLNKERPNWGWSLIANGDVSDIRVRTDSAQSSGTVVRLSPSTSKSLDIEGTMTGRPFTLPAGNVSLTLQAGQKWSGLERGTLTGTTAISRGDSNGGVSIDIPIARRSENILAWAGDFSVNANFSARELTDAGTLKNWGYGFVWSPVTPLRLIFSVAKEEEAASVQQLGDPALVTPGVRIFDYVRGTTVLINRTDGGNTALISDDRRVIKAGLTLKPFEKTDLTLTANYIDSRTRNPIVSFDGATAAFETAFPQRFIRDSTGVLTAIDSRPVNIGSQSRSELRWGVNFSKPLKTPPVAPEIMQKMRALFAAGQGPQGPGAPGGAPAGAPPGSGGGGRGFGGGGGARLLLSFYHTWRFKEEAVIRPGIAPLNLLQGDTLGSLTGGKPRHEFEAQVGFSRRGLGARVEANWQQSTTVNGIGAQDLHFSDRTRVNLRLFVNPTGRPEWIIAKPWLRGTRLSLTVENLFNDRVRVTDRAGSTPLGYQPALLDPLGRTVRLSLRKVFF